VIDLVNTSNTYVVYSNVVPDPPIDSIVKGVEVLQKEKAKQLIINYLAIWHSRLLHLFKEIKPATAQ